MGMGMADSAETKLEEEAAVVGDRYELLSMLGTGSMGVVYRVRDRELDEVVALKLVQSHLVTDDDALARFRTEVKLARRVTHLNVARTFDIGKHGNDSFLTMEYVEGASLAAMLISGGPLSFERTVDVATQVCAALGAAHAVDVVHRDLKPGNVMWTSNGRAVVTDFGIACLRAEASPSSEVVGTPAYMAPEQLLAEGSIDGRADIFGLGALVYVLLTNERPFAAARTADGWAARLSGPAPDPRRVRADVPDALADTVMRCLAPDREARFAKIGDVAAALAELSSTRVAPPVRKVRVVAPGLERRPGVRTVAMMPFHNAGAASDAYLADGFTHDLVDALGRVRALNVRAVSASPGGNTDARAVARRLGADAVVEGSVFRIGESVRVTARVVAVENDLQLWGARLTRPFADLLATGDDVASSIAGALTAARDAPLRASADPVAVDFYLRARAIYHEYSPNRLDAPVLFEKALALAPDDPTILAAYALALVRGLGPFGTRDMTIEHARARAAAERAASVAPHLAEGHLALARVRFDDAELAAAARSLARALDISPRNADAIWLWGWMHAEIGDLAMAIARLDDAAVLDPRMGMLRLEVMRAHALLGNWRAVDALGAIEPKPAAIYATLVHKVRLFTWRRDVAAVQAIANQGLPADYKTLTEFVSSTLQGRMTDGLADILAGAADVTKDVPRLHAFAHQIMCEYRAYGDERGAALDHLEASDGARLFDINWLDRCPLLEDLRADPRFRAVRARVAERAEAGLHALREIDG
jgi:TolB-like protein